ncbi:D-alanine--D-alanine ligase [uncultured Mailhella sp.]|uniref:D-alanine--D-alanine ligase family protein n=1 Tax=uncultured Mailhella sp. TaxID=1981031 RepID=UPI0025EDB8A7|nr:D-alanine--D-alanine ligase [uncultured Mailhella sp.]
MRILLVAGGWSTEREISLKGAASIAEALSARGHEVTLFDLSDGFEKLLELAAAHDAAFLNLHGQPGEDGLVQALLERAGCPYQGSGPAGSFLALNKAAGKALFVRAGIRTPDYEFLPVRPAAGWKTSLPFPLFIKSNTGGSSIDLFRVNDEAELNRALDTLFAGHQEVLIETLIPGQEVTCGVVGRPGEEKALAPVLIVPKREFFDFHDKYAADGAAEICPAPLAPELTARVQEAAIAAHRCLGLSGYSRTDFRLTDEGELFALEVNTLPGMTSASLVPKEAAAAGIDFGELLETLLSYAVRN